LHFHDAVRVEKEGNLNATYDNGTAGVGATLTNAGTQEALVIDGVTLNTSDRVLVYEQTDQTQNGVYTVTDTGSVSTNWVLTRSTDTDSYEPGTNDGLDEGSYFYVQEGTAGAGESYVCNTIGTITFGTTNITFIQFSATPDFTGGTNIDITGQTISLTGTVDETNGGTGNNAYTTGDTLYASASNTLAKLSGNTTTTKKYLSQTGNGAASAAPAWDEINLGTDTAGDYIATGAVSGVGLSGSASGEGSTFTVTSNATNANTASTIVARDASGNFSAGTITAALSGNASTATTWQTARSLTLSGDVTGTATGINGSGNIAVTTTIAANSVALGTDTTGNYVAALSEGTAIDITSASGEGVTPTISIDLNELATSTTNTDGDYFVVVDSADGSQHKLTKGNIAISGFNNDSGFTTNTGTVTSVGVTAGSGLTGGGTVTTSGSVTLNVGAGNLIDVNADTIDVDLSELATSVTDGDGDFFVVVDSVNAQRKLTKGNINISGFNNDAGYTTNVGDITGVTAGNGLTGGGASGSVTLNVGAGTGVTVAADTVSIGQAVATSSNVQFNSIGVNTAGSGTAGEIRATGDITSNYSDARLKNIEGNIPDALAKVKSLGGYYFTENQTAKDLGYDNDAQQVGVIAQEVEEVLPEAVKPAPIDEKYLTVQYEKLVPLLIEAIKELEARVAELEA
jgi:hypothetical protein